MKDETPTTKEVRSDIRWYGISAYKKIISASPKSNEDIEVEVVEGVSVEFPDHLGNKINILI